MNLQQFEIRVNEKPFQWDQPQILGMEVLRLIGLVHSNDYEILIKLKNKEFEPVELTESVDLTDPAVETFFVKPYPSVSFELDDEDYPFAQVFMTPKEIMNIANVDATKFYLKQILGHQEITYKHDPDHIIAMHDKIKFCTCKTGNTTVS